MPNLDLQPDGTLLCYLAHVLLGFIHISLEFHFFSFAFSKIELLFATLIF